MTCPRLHSAQFLISACSFSLSTVSSRDSVLPQITACSLRDGLKISVFILSKIFFIRWWLAAVLFSIRGGGWGEGEGEREV